MTADEAGGRARTDAAIPRVEGSALALRGDDVDTDRILPGRFLKAVTFEGIERHVFADDRAAAGGSHPFDDPRFAAARILVVNRNFGCGSSREHAPQAIQRRGIAAIVGESFSEIFFGNAAALGLPCAVLPRGAVTELQALAETAASDVVVDLEAGTVAADGESWRFSMPSGVREAFLTGHWDGTSLLLAGFEEVRRAASRLPYLSGFRT